MIGRRSAFALAVLCAVVVSAFSVGSASATTAFTCVKNVNGDKFGAHCLNSGPTEKYSHLSFNQETEITGTNNNTASETTAAAASILAGSISGIATELECTGLSGVGKMSNKEEAGVMFAHGTGVLTYTGCSVVKPAGKGCVVNSGKVITKELTAKSENETTLAFKPLTGETFASITIEKCSVSALNNTFPVTGSLKGTVTGATTTTTEAGVTTQGTLKFGGNAAGLGGALTIIGAANPLVLTG